MADSPRLHQFGRAGIRRRKDDVPTRRRLIETGLMALDYIPRTRELYRSFNNPYQWVANDDVPWTPLKKRIADCKIALMSSGGILWRDQPRFHREDASYRRISKPATRDELNVWHFGYRTDDAQRDPNCVFPLERMRELETERVIGE